MTKFSRLTPLVKTLPASVPFVGPETQERQRGSAFAARVGANESVFGPSPAAVKAMQIAATEVWQYPDPEAHDLLNALGAHLGLPSSHVMVGEGIDGLLGLIVRLVVEKDVPVVTSLGAYPTFNYHVAGFGGRLVTVPYVDDREDPDSLLGAVKRENAPLVYLANPDNPMGSWWPAERIEAFVDALPETTLLVLDEAYGEMAPDGTMPANDAFIDRPNVLRARTFSKAYGMAGLRLGYVFGHPDTIRSFHKIRNHFGVGRLVQAAGIAALGDRAWLQDVLGKIAAGRDIITQIAADNGLKALPSATNFVAIDCGRDGDFAGAVMQGLIARGVFVRMPGVEPLNRCIRVSVGQAADMTLFAEVLPQALDEVALTK